VTGVHRIRDIAEQSGLSEATVDRVLHQRPGASRRAVRAVERALADLDRQESQLSLGGRTLLLDVVMQAPERFSGAVRVALESELPGARPAVVRARFDLRESADPAAAAEVLDALGTRRRPSHGVLLKAPDHPEVADAAARLAARGIPVVTVVTDVRSSGRIAYVGLDNAAAGATAAYLLSQWLRRSEAEVLLTLSRSSFVGERERAQACQELLAQVDPGRAVHVVTDTDGLDETLAARVRDALAARPRLGAVYSVGGGNRAILQVFAQEGRAVEAFVAHDLDEDNLALLRDGSVSAVLHHDLRADMRAAMRQVMRYHRLQPGAPTSVAANVQVVTPHNVPGRMPPS
jgi:LacI family transcriptional regulator